MRSASSPQIARRALRHRHLHNLNRQVVAPESVNEKLRLPHSQLRHDIRLHRRSSRRRQRQHRHRTRTVAQPRQILPQHPVVGPEVMPPLRNAVRFVNCNQRGLALRQHLWKPRHPQSLRRNEQKVQRPLQIVEARLSRHSPIQPRVNPRHTQPKRRKFRHLVFHQRNQRRNHQRRSAQRNRRQLVAERLARPGRHHQQQIAPVNRSATHLLLVRAKPRKPKHRPQQFSQIFRIVWSGQNESAQRIKLNRDIKRSLIQLYRTGIEFSIRRQTASGTQRIRTI